MPNLNNLDHSELTLVSMAFGEAIQKAHEHNTVLATALADASHVIATTENEYEREQALAVVALFALRASAAAGEVYGLIEDAERAIRKA